MAGINMADWPKNRHIIPAIIIPPKVIFRLLPIYGLVMIQYFLDDQFFRIIIPIKINYCSLIRTNYT